MNFLDVIKNAPFIFTEGAVVERLRREFAVSMHPYLEHATLIYRDETKAILQSIYQQYIDTVKRRNAPILIFTPTWRANYERIHLAGMSDKNINGDCVQLLKGIRNGYHEYRSSIFIGGIMGSKGDAYKAEEALSSEAAYEFHRWQAKQLSDAEVDFLFGATLPATSEALGLAMAMAETGKPYVISFVIRPDGTLLDGVTLHDAISKIDAAVSPRPAFFMVNCVHPSVLLRALTVEGNATQTVQQRLLGIQANTSSKSPEELDGNESLIVEDIDTLVSQMEQLRSQHHLLVFGGCCGTDHQHIQRLVETMG